MSDKTVITTISISKSESRSDYLFELLATDEKRWSGPKRSEVNETDTPYITFAVNINTEYLVAIYKIKEIKAKGVDQRDHWTKGEYINCNTVIFHNIPIRVATWEEFCGVSKSGTGKNYELDKRPQGTKVYNIGNSLLKVQDKDQFHERYTKIIRHIFLDYFDRKSRFCTAIISNQKSRKSLKFEDRFEYTVKLTLKEHFPNYDFIHNKQVRHENGKITRPDFYRIFKRFVLIIEYDEDNHASRSPSDELTRMNLLKSHFRKHFNIPTIFVRYGNKYQDDNDGKLFIDTIGKIIKQYSIINEEKKEPCIDNSFDQTIQITIDPETKCIGDHQLIDTSKKIEFDIEDYQEIIDSIKTNAYSKIVLPPVSTKPISRKFVKKETDEIVDTIYLIGYGDANPYPATDEWRIISITETSSQDPVEPELENQVQSTENQDCIS